MEVKTSDVRMESNEQLQGKSFTIATNAKAFEILTSTLYSNVPSSIVRELISNGYDGHVRAGNVLKEIDVHCPTVFEPTFEVRDYGCSMDEETMMNVYTTFFSSTKNGGNSEVGGFGLGCKLPFAYTDMFTITTYLNGKRQDYIASKENGVPTLNKMGDAEDTDEPNGVKVCVPVQEDDMESFEDAVEYMIKYSTFPIKSNLECQPAKEYDCAGIFSYHNYGNAGKKEKKQIIRVGGVPYRLNCKEMAAGFNMWDNVKYYKAQQSYDSNRLLLHKALCEVERYNSFDLPIEKLFDYNGCLDFEIGELDITASRESLQYSVKTKMVLFKRLVELQTKLYDYLYKKISVWNDNMQTLDKAIDKFKELLQFNYGSFASVSRAIRFNYKVGGFESYINIDSYDPSLLCYSEEIVQKNSLLDGLETPRCHTLNADTKRIQHSIKMATISLTKTSVKQDIYITNAPLKYSGINVDEKKIEEFGRYNANEAIITVAQRSDVQKQGELLQKRLDAIAPNIYNVIVVDKKNCAIPKATRQIRRVKDSKEEVVDEKPMTIAAKQLIASMQPIVDYFGKIYLFKGNGGDYARIKSALSALDLAKDFFGIPSMQPILNCFTVHGTARKLVEKIADVPVVYFEDEDDANDDIAKYELIKRLQKQLTQLDLFVGLSRDVKILMRGCIKYGEKYAQCDTLKHICKVQELGICSVPSVEKYAKVDANAAVLTVCKNFLYRMTEAQRNLVMANIFYQNSFYYSAPEFNDFLRSLGLTIEE